MTYLEIQEKITYYEVTMKKFCNYDPEVVRFCDEQVKEFKALLPEGFPDIWAEGKKSSLMETE